MASNDVTPETAATLISVASKIFQACKDHNYDLADYYASRLPLEYEAAILNADLPNVCVTIRRRFAQLPAHIEQGPIHPETH